MPGSAIPSENNPKQSTTRALHNTLQQFSSLADLFDTKWAAPCLLHSDDASLQVFNDDPWYREKKRKESIPEIFKDFAEAKFIWQTIHKPSTNLGQIKARQEVIRSLTELEDLKEVKKLKNLVYNIQNGIEGLSTFVDVGRYHQFEALSVYRQWLNDENTPGGDQAAKIVKRSLASIETGKESLLKLEESLVKAGEPLAAIGSEFLELSKAFEPFDHEYFIENGSFGPKEVHELISKINEKNILFGSLIEFANLIVENQEDFHSAKLDLEKDPTYEEGHSIVCPDTKKHKNPAPAHSKGTIFCGGNMTGKSQTGLKQNFYIQLLVQTFGYTTAKNGNFHIYDSFSFIDRATSDHDHNLSAFGKSVTTHVDVLSKLGNKPFACLDEPYSEASPEGQRKVLTGQIAHLIEDLDARVFIATHSEPIVHSAQSDPNCRTYYFDTEDKKDGTLRFLYKLKEGIADSNSIQVARGLEVDSVRVNQELIDGAARYIEGTIDTALPKVPLVWPSLERYSEAERKELKKGTEGLYLLIDRPRPEHRISRQPKGKERKTFYAFSGDKDLAQRFIPVIDQKASFLGFRNYLELGGWEYSSGGNKSVITKIILDSTPPTPQELFERQKTFKELVANDRYDELVDLETEMAVSLKFSNWLTYYTGFLLDFNRQLSPFKFTKGGSEDLNREDRESLVVFFKMNQKLLKDRFPFAEILEQYETAIKVEKAVNELYKKQSLIDLSKLVDQRLKRKISGKALKAYNDLLKHLGKEDLISDESVSEKKAFELIYEVEDKKEILDKDGRKVRPFSTLSYYLSENSLRRLDLAKITERLSEFSELFPEANFECESITVEKIDYFKDLIKEKRKGKLSPLDVMDGKEDKYSEFSSFLYDLQNRISSAQWKIDIPDSGLRETVKRLHKAWEVNDLREAPSSGNLTNNFRNFISHIKKQLEKLPPVCALTCDLSEIDEELKFLSERIKEVSKNINHNYDNSWPDYFKVVMALEVATQKRNPYGEFIAILRSYDSIHMQQFANIIEDRTSEYGSLTSPGDIIFDEKREWHYKTTWKERKKHLVLLIGEEKVEEIDRALEKGDEAPLKELFARLKMDDPRKIFSIAKKVYKKKIEAMHLGIVALEKEYQKLLNYPWISNYDISEAKKLVKGKDRDLSSLYKINRTYEEYADEDASRVKLPDFTGDNHEERRLILEEFYESTIRNSPLIQSIKDSIKARKDLNKRTILFCKAHGLELDEERKSFLRINDAMSALRDYTWRSLNKLFNFPFGAFRERGDDLSPQITGAVSTALLGRYLKENECAAVDFNETGVLHLEDLYSIFESKDQVRHTIYIDENRRVFIVNGPTMSGKTVLEKSLDISIPMGITTGFTTAKRAKMPLYAGAMHFDRITAKKKKYKKLSAGGNEFMVLTEGLEIAAASKTPMFITTDEMGSTMSPQYQAAFGHSFVNIAHGQGHYLVFSSHNHKLIRELDRLSEQTRVYYLDYEINALGEIDFKFKLTPGYAPSEEIAVARKLGMPEAILRRAETA